MDGDAGSRRHHRHAVMEGEQFVRGFNFSFGKNPEDAAVMEHSKRGAGGGGVLTGAAGGNGADGATDGGDALHLEILRRHHPGDETRAGGLNQERVEGAGVITDEDGRSDAGQLAGGGDGEIVNGANVKAADRLKQPNGEGGLDGRALGRAMHGAREYRPQTTEARRGWGFSIFDF